MKYFIGHSNKSKFYIRIIYIVLSLVIIFELFFLSLKDKEHSRIFINCITAARIIDDDYELFIANQDLFVKKRFGSHKPFDIKLNTNQSGASENLENFKFFVVPAIPNLDQYIAVSYDHKIYLIDESRNSDNNYVVNPKGWN